MAQKTTDALLRFENTFLGHTNNIRITNTENYYSRAASSNLQEDNSNNGKDNTNFTERTHVRLSLAEGKMQGRGDD